VAAKLTQALEAVTKDAGFVKQMTDMGIAVTWMPPATVQTMIPSEVAQWARVTKSAGIQPE
jgi:tripartite-type tricarboxylate transporter receptor subunit TctC